MKLKNVVIMLVVIVVVLSTGLYIVSSSQYNIYTDAEHVTYDQVLDEKEVPTVYYYYQDTCHFCNSIKDQVTDLYLAMENNDKINMKLVDLKSSKNKDGWSTDPTYDPETVDMTDVNNIKATGTPTMIYVKNGEVVEYEIGPDVFTLMENVNQEFDLGLTFDPSRYGKE